MINDSVVQLSRTTNLWPAALLQPGERICVLLRNGSLHLTVAMAKKEQTENSFLPELGCVIVGVVSNRRGNASFHC